MKNFLLVAIVVFVCASAEAPDPKFTQFYANTVYIIPAVAGSHGGPRMATN